MFPLSILVTVNDEQGSNDTFVFTDRPGHPVIFRPTGIVIFRLFLAMCEFRFSLGG